MQSGAESNGSSLWRWSSKLGGLETSRQPRRLHASDCRARTEACNFVSGSVHVPTVISTPQRGEGHNGLPFEGSPADLVSDSQPPPRRPYFREIARNNSRAFGECGPFVTTNTAEHEHICIFIICKTVSLQKVL